MLIYDFLKVRLYDFLAKVFQSSVFLDDREDHGGGGRPGLI